MQFNLIFYFLSLKYSVLWLHIFVICLDRKKDLIKLAHGEYISLGRVETTLLTNPHVDNICVYGNSQRDFLIALVVPNQKNLESLAEKVRAYVDI